MQENIQMPSDYVKPESKFFCFYRSYCTVFAGLSDAKAGQLIKAMAAYYLDGTLKPMNRYDAALFSMFQFHIDADRKKYDKVCERNWINAQSRRKQESTGSQSNPEDNAGD